MRKKWLENNWNMTIHHHLLTVDLSDLNLTHNLNFFKHVKI